jgi:hypothetical protein
MSEKHRRTRLDPGDETDYLFQYFINEDKFNEQLRGEFEEKMEKKSVESERAKKTERSEEKIKKKSEEFKRTERSEKSVEHIGHSEPTPHLKEKTLDKSVELANSSEKKNVYPNVPHRSEVPVNPPPVYPGLPPSTAVAGPTGSRRARARENLSRLQELAEKYHIKLTREYTLDDDPEEMEAEYKIHKEKRDRVNQIKFYKQILLNIVYGIEFLNERYNPFEFHLRDWSKQVAADIDDYTEVLEEIYEKYKGSAKLQPEIRLLLMIILSGITYHLSQSLFGSNGLGETLRSNPNIINKILNNLIKGKNNNDTIKSKHEQLLESIRNQKMNPVKDTVKNTVKDTVKDTIKDTVKDTVKDNVKNTKVESTSEQILGSIGSIHNQKFEKISIQIEQLQKQINNLVHQIAQKSEKQNMKPMGNFPSEKSPEKSVEKLSEKSSEKPSQEKLSERKLSEKKLSETKISEGKSSEKKLSKGEPKKSDQIPVESIKKSPAKDEKSKKSEDDFVGDIMTPPESEHGSENIMNVIDTIESTEIATRSNAPSSIKRKPIKL